MVMKYRVGVEYLLYATRFVIFFKPHAVKIANKLSEGPANENHCVKL